MNEYGPPYQGWREKAYRIVFEDDTPAGALFDKALIAAIIASILTVMLDSVPSIHARWAKQFMALEWGFTLLFTAEYALRILCLREPKRYTLSFYGIVDLLAVLPTYLVLFFPNLHVLIDVRVIRLLRIFRIFKLASYVREFQTLSGALAASFRKITVFLCVVVRRLPRGIDTSPLSGSSIPAITRTSVDLPAPLRPIRPMRPRGGSLAVASSIIVRPPRRTVIPVRLSMGRT